MSEAVFMSKEGHFLPLEEGVKYLPNPLIFASYLLKRKKNADFRIISVTVPSIVIMVPGLYLYRGFYNLGIMSLSVSASWFAAALLIIAALPLGLIFARILTDKAFRYCT